MDAPDDDFEELRALKAEIAARHRRLIRVLLGVGVALLAVAALLYVFLDTEERPGLVLLPLALASFGLAVTTRALYSAFTDVDTKVREDEFIGLPDFPEAGNEGKEKP